MVKRDLILSVAAAIITVIYVFPTLINTGFYFLFSAYSLLFVVSYPILATIGMFTANFLAKKIAILWQVAKFGLVGVLNTAIDFGILNFLIAMTGATSGLGIVFINATSFSTALINSYFWNRDWVFSQAKSGSFVTFMIVTLIGLSINTGIVYGLTTYVPRILVDSPELWVNLSKVAATVLSLIWNFTGYKLIVFKK